MNRRLRRIVFVVLAGLGIVLSLNTLTYLNFDPAYGFLKLKQEAIASGWYLPGYYAHIFAGGLILTAGFFQFSKSIRNRYKGFHRSLGFLYISGVLFFSAPGGLVMAFFIDRGALVLASFLLQCGLWISCTVIAFQKVRHHDYIGHERWMIRSFSLTLAAVTLRVYIFCASWFVDLGHPLAYGITAWLSWIPNLAIAETIIRKKLHPPVSGLQPEVE